MSQKSAETLYCDNTDLLKKLCGVTGSHLSMIEQALNVLIKAPGGHITVIGQAQNTHKALGILKNLYKRLEAGQSCEEVDVETALHMSIRGKSLNAPDKEYIQLAYKRLEGRNSAQRAYIRALKTHDLVFALGPAGTGKTFLAVAHGVESLLKGRHARLIITRPAVEAGERLGFLPGDMAEKLDPYLQPVWDALDDVLGSKDLEKRRQLGQIELAPLAFMRGRTLKDAYIVVDEAQNATKAQMRMLLTRLGEGSRMSVSGDPTQSDLPGASLSGLAHAIELLEDEEDIAVTRFSASDVVRHPLVARIVRRYESTQQASFLKEEDV